jgi:hypothetical protein
MMLFFLACNSSKTTTSSTNPPIAKIDCGVYIFDLRNDIVPIINQHCVSCHSKGSNLGGYDFTIVSHIERAAFNGDLLGTIKWKMGYKPMPENAAKLDAALITKIECWIMQEKAK